MPSYILSANRNSVQEDPYLLQLRDGSILGLWSDLHPDPGVEGHFGVYGRLWRGDLGAAAPNDVRTPDLTEDIQTGPAATSFANGNFAVIFESRGPSAVNGHHDAFYDSYIKFYDADGTARGPARQLTPNIPDDHYAVDIVTLVNQQSVTLVARQEGGGVYDLLAYRHNANGRQIGNPVEIVSDARVYVNSWTGADYIAPSIAASADGRYAVSWHERTEQGALRGYAVWVQVFGADGTPVGGPRVAAPLIAHPDARFGLEQDYSDIAGRTTGGYALAWHRQEPGDTRMADIHFRLLDADGSGATRAVMVNSDRRAGDQILQDVVDLGAGRTLVTYFDHTEEGGHLYGRAFGPGGRALHGSFRITDGAPYDQMTGGNTIINSEGRVVSSFQAELAYAYSDDMLITARSLTLPAVRAGGGDDRLQGTFVNDRLYGQQGRDTLAGDRGNDLLHGGAGDDRLLGQNGDDRLVGGGGRDALLGGGGRDDLRGGAGHDRLEGGAGRDLLAGGSGNDRLLGQQGNDTLDGGAGDDRLDGGPGQDRLTGGAGADLLRGGAGADVFVFRAAADSPPGGGRDRIADFRPGTDRLDLRGIDADNGLAGDQSFAFSAGGAQAHSVWAARTGDGLTLRGDVDGDGRPDFVIDLAGLTRITADDLLL